MKQDHKATNTREAAIIELLWGSLKRDPDHKDRRRTGWGTKTEQGLIACVERIAAMPSKEVTP